MTGNGPAHPQGSEHRERTPPLEGTGDAETRVAETTDMASPRRPADARHTWPPRLTVVASPDHEKVGNSALLAGETLLFGRDVTGPGIAIADPSMSRVHTRCVWDARMGSLRANDVGSRNGTYVNGRRVESVLLGHGDVLRVGDTLLVYREEDASQRALERALAVARSPLSVLLVGETGTGKELIAHRIHEASGRSGKLVPVNCGAIPRDLVAAELFGHTERAFSGAGAARKGLVMSAAAGTLLLDEIGDCPLEAQVALLRMLQEKSVRAVGADRETVVDVRVIAATNRDLRAAVSSGSFRADLLARLSQIEIGLPPLRERRHELLQLAHAFARQHDAELTIDVDAAEALLLWTWPFNMRELQALISELVVMGGKAPRLDLAYLSHARPQLAAAIVKRADAPLDGALAPHPVRSVLPTLPQPKLDRVRLRSLMEEHAGNVSQVAKVLGKPRAQIYRWMEALGLSAEQFRNE